MIVKCENCGDDSQSLLYPGLDVKLLRGIIKKKKNHVYVTVLN